MHLKTTHSGEKSNMEAHIEHQYKKETYPLYRCFTKNKLVHLDIGEYKGAPMRLIRLYEEDKLDEQGCKM